MRASLDLNTRVAARSRVAEGLRSESIYGRLAAHSAVHHCSPEELGLTASTIDRPLFGSWSAAMMQSVSRLLGVNANEVYLMRGRPSGSEYNAITVRWLRFCRRCMTVGYHPALHQYIGIDRCELHNEPLCITCSGCGLTIVPTLRMTMLWPHRCPRCENLLAGSSRDVEDVIQLRQFDEHLAARTVTLPDERPISTRLANFEPDSLSSDLPAAVISRWLRRFGQAYWGQRATKPLYETIEARDTDAGGCGRTRFLIWLVSQGHFVDEARRLALHLGNPPGELRPPFVYSSYRGYSAAAIAIYKTLYTYSLVQDFLDFAAGERTLRFDTQSRAPHRYSKSCFNRSADARLLQLEMLGLLAVLLAQLRRHTSIQDVSWRDLPSPLAWVPTWANQGIGFPRVALSMRTNEQRVERLLQSRRFKLRATSPHSTSRPGYPV